MPNDRILGPQKPKYTPESNSNENSGTKNLKRKRIFSHLLLFVNGETHPVLPAETVAAAVDSLLLPLLLHIILEPTKL